MIGLLRENEKIVLKYKELNKSKIEKGITSYTIAELYEGVKRVESKKKMEGQLKILEILLKKFEKRKKIFSLTRNEAMKYAELKIVLEKKGKPIPIMDLLIGTIAIVNNYKLITTDKNHFQNLKDVYPSFNAEFWI
ncbi:MAG TPA: type II toxin-antitoxin system VapC family toxin [Candidatus Lokiarchaeia archaeon]